MNAEVQEAFWSQLSRVKHSTTKPTPFNSSCGLLVPSNQQWKPPLVHNDKDCKSDEENELEITEAKSMPNEVKLRQGYQNSGYLCHMVCLLG